MRLKLLPARMAAEYRLIHPSRLASPKYARKGFQGVHFIKNKLTKF